MGTSLTSDDDDAEEDCGELMVWGLEIYEQFSMCFK